MVRGDVKKKLRFYASIRKENRITTKNVAELAGIPSNKVVPIEKGVFTDPELVDAYLDVMEHHMSDLLNKVKKSAEQGGGISHKAMVAHLERYKNHIRSEYGAESTFNSALTPAMAITRPLSAVNATKKWVAGLLTNQVTVHRMSFNATKPPMVEFEEQGYKIDKTDSRGAFFLSSGCRYDKLSVEDMCILWYNEHILILHSRKKNLLVSIICDSVTGKMILPNQSGVCLDTTLPLIESALVQLKTDGRIREHAALDKIYSELADKKNQGWYLRKEIWASNKYYKVNLFQISKLGTTVKVSSALKQGIIGSSNDAIILENDYYNWFGIPVYISDNLIVVSNQAIANSITIVHTTIFPFLQ